MNGSGATLSVGQVVVLNPDGVTVTTTTTISSDLAYGVVLPRAGDGLAQIQAESFPANALLRICHAGPARINIGSNTVAAGGLLSTSATAGQAAVPATAATLGEVIAVALEASTAVDANGNIRALIAKM